MTKMPAVWLAKGRGSCIRFWMQSHLLICDWESWESIFGMCNESGDQQALFCAYLDNCIIMPLWRIFRHLLRAPSIYTPCHSHNSTVKRACCYIVNAGLLFLCHLFHTTDKPKPCGGLRFFFSPIDRRFRFPSRDPVLRLSRDVAARVYPCKAVLEHIVQLLLWGLSVAGGGGLFLKCWLKGVGAAITSER